jgi:thiamine-monophosphate kinase
MKLSRIGEFGLIDRLERLVSHPDEQLVVGIGDDAAAVRTTPDRLLLLTADVLVERVHFDRRIHSFQQIGWRAMVANISDIAAMGGMPKHALISICLPGSMRVEEVEEIYGGLNAAAQEYGCAIIGGDTVTSPRDLVVSVALTGEVSEERLVTRGGARVGDLICVTGQLGGAQAGLAMLRLLESTGTSPLPEEQWVQARDRHLWPRPRLREAQEVVRSGRIGAMIDVSDGLAGEVGHIARRSGVGAEIWEEKIPIGPQTLRVAEQLGISVLELALCGGEDFELVFTIPTDGVRDVTEIVFRKTGTKISTVGKILPAGEGLVQVSSKGKKKTLVAEGFRHF